MSVVAENLAYKSADHAFRSRDAYAQGKYDVTTRWIRRALAPGQLLLNVGCGSGEYNATAHALGLRVIACEPDALAYERALATAPPGCEIKWCGLMELDAPPADFVVMHDVLEHIEDEAAAVHALRRLLRPGGIAIVSVPAYQWLFGHHDVQLGHYRRYTRGQLVRALSTELEIERARYYGAAMLPIALWFSRLARRDYPVAAASEGPLHRVMELVCGAEARIALPVGTSVLVRARAR